jgi:hypothetical protein
MKKNREPGASLVQDDPRDKEHKDIIGMLEFPNTLDCNMLKAVQPTTWKNVGPNVIHAIAILISQSTTFGGHFSHLK